MMKLSEATVKRQVRYYLDRKGYREADSRERHETGPDLTMRCRSNGRCVIIEAKGDTAAKSGMENKILAALGQTLTRFKQHPNYYFGLAVPSSWKPRLLGKLQYDVMRALNLVLYFVDESGAVEEVGKGKFRASKAAATR